MRFLFILLLFLYTLANQSKAITIGDRVEIHSKILNDDRELLIYTPPSYHFSKLKSFPVLYILDADYNFQYVTGLVELWSSISEDIPEIIVVGLSGKGTLTYRKNSKPPFDVKDKGNADRVLEFINKELKAYIDQNYKTNGYNILAGHSVGGLFTTYASITSPEAFNQFIAISPSLWWENQVMKSETKKIFEENKELTSHLYISLANEKGMGVHGFVEMIQNHAPKTFIYHFKHFPDESHGSVGLPTYQWALKDIFADSKLKDKYFINPKSVGTHYKYQVEKYKSRLPIAAGYLRNTAYSHKENMDALLAIDKQIEKFFPESAIEFKNLIASTFLDKKQYKKAQDILNIAIKSNPEYFENYQTQAKLYQAQKQPEKAKKSIKKALELAKQQNIRQWLLNEVIELSQEFKVSAN